MFIEIFIFSLLIGYLSGGKLKNFEFIKINGLYIIFISFAIEFCINMLLRNKILSRGILTYLLDLIMYSLLLYFTFLNRKNKFIVLIGIGFIMNALPIFFNSGAMPVSSEAIIAAGISPSINDIKVSNEGLYTLINNETKLWYLGDIIPKPFLRPAVISIGDIISGIGLILLIIKGMKKSVE